jgi:hypothetical protein
MTIDQIANLAQIGGTVFVIGSSFLQWFRQRFGTLRFRIQIWFERE